jgi:hypothetical protein
MEPQTGGIELGLQVDGTRSIGEELELAVIVVLHGRYFVGTAHSFAHWSMPRPGPKVPPHPHANRTSVESPRTAIRELSSSPLPPPEPTQSNEGGRFSEPAAPSSRFLVGHTFTGASADELKLDLWRYSPSAIEYLGGRVHIRRLRADGGSSFIHRHSIRSVK